MTYPPPGQQVSPTLHTPGVLGQQNSSDRAQKSDPGQHFVPLRQPVDMLSGQQKSLARTQ
ncbi:hypothetical protein IMZ48_39560 [Candidatus Bathyarchaeota archaeon]|nr:hypothetical protein [Candidatus Bathyarchaeota archaeon]